MRYQVYVLESVFEAIASRKGRKRRELKEFIRSLSDNPFNEGDFLESDSVGRTIFTKLIRDHAVVYAVDHAAKEVKVVEIVQVDQ